MLQILGPGGDTVADEKLTVEQKFAKILLQLRSLRPFYSAIYEVMPKVKTDSIDTVGVTTNKLYYSKKYIKSRDMDELIFVFLHEICHIALMHVARRGNRDKVLWNVAADLYTNAVLVEEFKLEVEGDYYNSSFDYDDEDGVITRCPIKFPRGALYCSTIDTDNDFVEEIYQDLENQAKDNGYNKATISGYLEGETFEFEYKGSKSKDNIDEFSTFKADINPDKYINDLIDEGKDQSVKNQESNNIVNDALVRVDMQGSGDSKEKLRELSKELLKVKIDWRKLLKRYLIKSETKDSTFSNPDKRMYYQKAIYPGQGEQEYNFLKGLKICIDTSGSVDDEELKNFMASVYKLTKQFKINAELVYWDNEVRSIGSFENYEQFERIKCLGGGGTQPKSVFEYFESKKCKVKPYVIIIITDGYFSNDWVTPRLKRKYRDTIWIMSKEYNKSFKPAFGRLAYIR